jgi:hypothetical protein
MGMSGCVDRDRSGIQNEGNQCQIYKELDKERRDKYVIFHVEQKFTVFQQNN